jgi:PAS domain S-box-containing protein
VNEASNDVVIGEQVRAEQLRTLYRQSAPVLLANVVNASIVSIALWSSAPHGLLIGWTSSIALMAVARIRMHRAYWARERTPSEQARWGARFTAGSLTAGLLWGFAGGVLMPDSLPHQVLLVFVLGGMAAGAAASIACYPRAYYAYIIPALLPAVARLLVGGDVDIALGAMLLLFSGALTLVARNVRGALIQAFQLRFENAGLYAQVSKAQASLVEANADLVRANQELETRVRERTAELRANERHLAEIVTESPDAIMVFDDTGHIVSANSAAEHIAGRPADALIGKHFADTGTMSHEDATRAVEAFEHVVHGETPVPSEFRIVRPDGQATMSETSVRLVRGHDGRTRVHAVLRDVTERHRVQRLKDAYESRMREAERLESVSLLAGGVAHDFNNMLTIILSNVDMLLLEDWVENPDVKLLLDEVQHASLQAASLTKQLLAFSRRQLLDVHPTDLAQIVNDARVMFGRALGEHNRLSIKVPTEPAVVLVDATQIEQAVLNLLVNARHAMPNGGRAEVEVRDIDVNDEADWPDAEPGPYVRLAVTDSGTGMDEATRSRVFEPFFTTKELGYGTGLGLSSVHGVITQAKGFIRVLSEPGRGTRFEIILRRQPALAREAAVSDGPGWHPGAGVVLVVEDQPQVRHLLARIMEDAGYEVVCADDGYEALDVGRKRDGHIDLVISDVVMPGLSGIELCRRLIALYPHLALLLVSGYVGEEIALLGELGENVQFLQKPFDAVTLTSAAQTALACKHSAVRHDRIASLHS